MPQSFMILVFTASRVGWNLPHYNVVVLLMTTAEVREAFRLVNYKYIHIYIKL